MSWHFQHRNQATFKKYIKNHLIQFVSLVSFVQECVAVLIELYKKNVTVSCVGSDLLSELTYTTEPRVVGTILEYYVRSD